ncbi:MAG: phosphoenolpyruvate--protein phosphotransferase [Candidatus Kapabacteria bacterium]|nr:phosphoenolpyruvate--protein phosphotransferase [Candidatus Kapabacteria bacterium]
MDSQTNIHISVHPPPLHNGVYAPLTSHVLEEVLEERDSGKPPSVQSQSSFRKTPHKEKRFKGIPASPGIVIGQAVTFVVEPITIKQTLIEPERIPAEIGRFHHAVEECTAELHRTIMMANDEAPVAAPILEAQLFMLNDPSVGAMVTEYIQKQYSADHAVQDVFDSQQAIMRHASDAYLRERAADLEHVKQRLLNFLANRNLATPEIAEGSIVISESLTPSEVMFFRKSGMAAFATESSGITSHAAILARSMAMPSVVGLANVCKRIHTGTQLIIDGFAGIIIAHPQAETLERYERRQQDLENKLRKLGKYAFLPSETLDGRKVHLFANADSPEEIEMARASGAEGIGLIRTELQLLERQIMPSEDEQTAFYKDLAERAYPLPITLRAFDIGSDKSFGLIGHEPNPALGLRGLRFLLKNRALFTAQIRAILRASCHRNVRVMLPMITTVQEFQKALSLIEGCKATLRGNGEDFDENIPIGAMIETPAAALIARELSAMADFFSIGTNDLTQYTLAADRMNAGVTTIFDTFHPAILRLLSMTIEAAQHRNIPVAVCGEFASHAAATELLIGMGVSELSVAHTSLLDIKKRIRKVNFSNTKILSAEALTLGTSSEVRKYLISGSR